MNQNSLLQVHLIEQFLLQAEKILKRVISPRFTKTGHRNDDLKCQMTENNFA